MTRKIKRSTYQTILDELEHVAKTATRQRAMMAQDALEDLQDAEG